MRFATDAQRKAVFANLVKPSFKTDMALQVIARTADEPVYQEDYFPIRSLPSDSLKAEINEIIKESRDDITVSEIIQQLERRYLTES